MLYSEFIEGTGCKDNQHNYELYKNLEIMYMNSDLPKSTIYEYGKKLADNSKSEKEIEVENQIKAEIESLKEEWSLPNRKPTNSMKGKFTSSHTHEYTSCITARHRREYTDRKFSIERD